jgi:hypothetical protein
VRVARLLLPVSILLFGLSAAPALASTQIGQLGSPYEAGQCASVAILQTTVETGTISYEVPAGGGVITSWATRTGKDAGTAKLKVFRKTAVATEFTVVGEDGPRQVKKETSPTFSGVRIPVQGGDQLGLIGSGTNCNSYHAGQNGYHSFAYDIGQDPAVGTTSPVKSGTSQMAIEVAATVEPDADGDNYGDETQDACLNNSLGHELPCPALPGPPAPPPIPDITAPQIILSSRAKQDALKAKAVIATVIADENVTFSASGSVNVPGAGAFSLTPTTAAGAANAKTSLSLGLSKTTRKKISTALKNGKTVKASLHVIAKDAAGNTSNATLPLAVTIKKSAPKKHK